MSMTKKDFIALADALRDGLQGNRGIAELLADFCAGQNPKFDRKRWLEYLANPAKLERGRQFVLTVDMENAAFENPGRELSKLLREVAEKAEAIDRRIDGGRIMDTNGNSVGSWEVR